MHVVNELLSYSIGCYINKLLTYELDLKKTSTRQKLLLYGALVSVSKLVLFLDNWYNYHANPENRWDSFGHCREMIEELGIPLGIFKLTDVFVQFYNRTHLCRDLTRIWLFLSCSGPYIIPLFIENRFYLFTLNTF